MSVFIERNFNELFINVGSVIFDVCVVVINIESLLYNKNIYYQLYISNIKIQFRIAQKGMFYLGELE